MVRGKFPVPVNPDEVARDWQRRGFSCSPFVDPPGRRWVDFVHAEDELLTVVEGRLRVTLEGGAGEGDEGPISCVVGPGDEVHIPAGTRHSVENVHPGTTRWLYGYRRA
ncbi:MAG: cupin domain-containing protein [Gammaproteobacteria bacterium]|nr:MAG: cupin domain-containing protein [Gammaproteobacteria bacterium]